MFETSMKENNELREFTTLEKQMFYDNNEQLKDLSHLRKQVDNLQIEKNESEKIIEKLKYSVQVVESEKLDIEIIIEEQRNKFEKRENELLATIQETKKELKSKEDQIKKCILSNNCMTEKQEEIKRLEMKIKEIYQLNNTYTNEIDTLKVQLLNKDQQLNVELSERCSLLKELSLLRSYSAEVKSIPCAIQCLADEGYFSLKKNNILGLVQLLEHIHDIVEQLEQKNKNLIDENNNLKLITNNFNIQMNNIKKENYGLRLKLNSIEEKIIFTIKEFSGSSEINIDNADTESLIEFAQKHFEENTNKVDILSNNNLILKEKLSISNIKLCEIISFVFNNLDYILQSISTMEERSSTEMEKLKKELSETIEENRFLKSSIQLFNILTFECVDIIEKVKINQSNAIYLQEELTVCNGVKNVLQLQIEELKGLNTNLNMLIENQTKVEKQIKDELDDTKFKLSLKNEELNERRIGINLDNESEIRNELIIKTKELETSVSQVYVLQLTIEEMKIKTNSNAITIEKLNNALDSIEFELKEKSKLVDEFKNNKSKATTCNNLEIINDLNEVITKLKSELEDKLINEKTLRHELRIVTVELDDVIVKVNEVKSVVDILNIKDDSKIYILQQLNCELKCIESKLNEKNEIIRKLENTNLELLTKCTNSDQFNKIITELKIELKNKINVESKLRDELEAKTMKLEYAMLQGNEIQTVVESMENEIKSNVVLIDQFKSELATKSNLLTKLENVNSELVLKCDKLNEILLNNTKDNEQYHLNIQNQLQQVSKEKLLIQNDLNLIIQQCIEISKHDESKKYLQDKVQLCVLNYYNLYTEFVHLSCDIESLLKCQTITVSNLREEILLKSAEIEHLQKQVLDPRLQQEYNRLEKDYMSRSCEYDEAQGKILHLESMLTRNEESENVLKNDYESKCIELEEYKKNIEFLVSRNDSFQIRVNDFENNVLVDLNEEFDLMKSQLAKKTDHEKMLLEEKANLKCNFEELQEQLINVTEEMKLKEEKCEDLATIINVLVNEIKDANSVKQNLDSCLNEAEHELLKYGDLCENLKLELYSVQRELENACIKAESIEKQLQNLEFKFNDKINKKYFDGCDVRNQLIDPLVDFVHDIKLKLTELNSAMISGNQSEKSFRTKVVSGNDYILPQEETWKMSCDSQPESPNSEVGLEIDNLLKILKEKNDTINTLHIAKNEMEKNICELRCQVKNQSDENIKHINDIQFMEIDLKEKMSLINNLNNELNDVQQLCTKLKEQINESREQNIKLFDKNEKLISSITLIENNLQDKTSLVCNLKNELNNLQIEHTKLKEHNQANKKQIDLSYDIDLELRNGKKNIINEINLLEPGKITGVLTDHNLSNLLDTFVNLIMTKEHQIVTNLASNHSKIIQLYEDKIKQMQEDIKKEKEWQQQVESDNEKLVLELENLKSQISNFPCRELKIKTLTEKVLKAENLSFNYLSELEELKTQLSKTSEQNFQALSHEFEVFKTNSDQSIQDLKNKLENLTKQYNETLSMCEVQKSCRFSLEDQIGKIQSECASLKSVIEKKDEDIKNLLVGFKLKTNEYEIMNKNHSLQKEEMRIFHEKKISDLQFDLSNTKHKMYCTEKLLKEINKNNENDKVKLNMNDNSLIDVNNVTDKLRTILKCNGTLSEIYENICSLMTKCEYLEEEIKELKHANVNLDNECESMLDEVNNKSNKITELLTQVDVLNRNIELLTGEREFLRNKCKQFKIFNNDLKKLNDEICSYEQNIYELRKDKGQLIVQHNKELKQLKNELQEIQAKNLELFNEYSALSETAKNLEKSLKEDIQQLNRCIFDKNAKISTLELFSKSYSDDLKKKNCELEIVFKRARDENHMLRSELRRLKKITNVCRADQCTQTVEEQSLMSSTIVTNQKCMLDKIAKFENDSKMMKMMLHHRKSKIEELEKQLNERHSKI
ncbi:putative leucine-rich repeat-containing protein DDB_G0290503 isoform X2 [Metopolophium dirhodum]|nr:putative leucine-rich repeat-containing protein DDB_G0290503 isoform X2 [Metopolophium dirhodum]